MHGRCGKADNDFIMQDNMIFVAFRNLLVFYGCGIYTSIQCRYDNISFTNLFIYLLSAE